MGNRRKNRNKQKNTKVIENTPIEISSKPLEQKEEINIDCKEIKDKEQILKDLEKKISDTQIKETVEKICLNVLEENIVEAKKKYNDILNLEIEIIEEFKNKAYSELEDKFNEAEALRQHYLSELKKYESLVEDKQIIFKKKEEESEKLIQEKLSNLDDEYYKKQEELKILEQKLEEEINLTNIKRNLLDKEFEEFKKDLEKEFKEKDGNLLSKFNKKNTQLDEDYNKKKLELEEEKRQNEESLKKEREDFENYIKEETSKLEKEKEEVDNYKKDILQKVDEQIEDKKQAFVDEMIYINSDYRNELDKKEWEVDRKESEFKNKAKQRELNLLKATKEYESKVDEFNEEVSKFNKDKKKFLEQHHWLHIIKRKIKEHLFASLILLVFAMFFSFFFLYSNEYKVFKNSFIASSIDRYINNKITTSEYTFSLNTSNSVLAKFTQLDGLNVDVDTSKNNSFSENYEKVTLNSGENSFVFERFYKNNNFIMKTPNFGQYIIVDDMTEFNYEYKEDEFNKSILDALKRSLSKNNNKNYTDVSKINVNGTSSFIDFINSSFMLSKDYEYFYTIENKDDVLFKEIFTNILESKNYSNFMIEEDDIAKKLEKNNEFKEIEDIITGIINNSKVKKNEINLKISKDLELSDIDITFNLEYKDDTMASSVPLTIKIRCSLDIIEEDVTLEKSQFRMNSVKIENLNTKKE